MKKILNVKLQRNPLSHNPTNYIAQVVTIGSVGLSEIIDEMIKENKDIDKETAFNLLNAFNRKAADLVISGYNVDTNLVTLSPTVNGSFYGGKFNHELSSVDISVKFGNELNKALLSSNFQVVEVENTDNKESNEQNEQLLDSFNDNISTERRPGYSSSLLNPEREPACGMAFRRWLCNS